MHGNANAADAQVKIANFTFEPPVLTLKVGTTVTWVNDDDIPQPRVREGRQVPLECARY
jgi:plastocyanin